MSPFLFDAPGSCTGIARCDDRQIGLARATIAGVNEHDRVSRVVEATLSKSAVSLSRPSSGAVEETVTALSGERARASLSADPYWPKWDTPWWRITLLDELGLAERVPPTTAQALLAAARASYITFFPYRVEEVPAGCDPVRGSLCHCALGTLERVLTACGIAVERELPWVRGWYVKYALADGGFNCDEAAYTRVQPHSSMVSTVPVLEVLLSRPDLTGEESVVLDRGARYLLDRRLCRSLSKGLALIDPAWLEPTFPRFYEYDILRGLSFVVRWARRRGVKLPPPAIAEAVEELAKRTAPDGTLAPHRRAWQGATTLAQDAAGAWTRGHPARSFPLLEEAGAVSKPSAALTREWRATIESLGAVLGPQVT